MIDIESQETQKRVEGAAAQIVPRSSDIYNDVKQEIYLSLLQGNSFLAAKNDAIDTLRSPRYSNSYARKTEHLHYGYAKDLDNWSWVEVDWSYEGRFINYLSFNEMLGVLSGKQKFVFEKLMLGMKEWEIAKMLSIGHSMVSKYKWRAIRRIRKQMQVSHG